MRPSLLWGEEPFPGMRIIRTNGGLKSGHVRHQISRLGFIQIDLLALEEHGLPELSALEAEPVDVRAKKKAGPTPM